DRLVVLLLAAAANAIAVDFGVAAIQPVGGDDHRRNAGARHAAGAGLSGLVAPRAVGLLGAGPIVERQSPGLVADRDPDAFGLVQRQQRELGVRVVPFGLRITP